MLARYAVTLHAINPERRAWRAYRLEAGVDMLGAWVVVVRWGRIGTDGRALQVAVADEAAARRLSRAKLRRRLSAPLRIGATYRVVELEDGLGWGDVDEAAPAPASSHGPPSAISAPNLGRAS